MWLPPDIDEDVPCHAAAEQGFQRSGNIMAMTSIAAKRLAPPGEICYSITKSGIELFCWGLAKELKGYNIAVNDLYPTGGVTTDGFKYVFRKKKLNEDLIG